MQVHNITHHSLFQQFYSHKKAVSLLQVQVLTIGCHDHSLIPEYVRCTSNINCPRCAVRNNDINTIIIISGSAVAERPARRSVSVEILAYYCTDIWPAWKRRGCQSRPWTESCRTKEDAADHGRLGAKPSHANSATWTCHPRRQKLQHWTGPNGGTNCSPYAPLGTRSVDWSLTALSTQCRSYCAFKVRLYYKY